MSNIFEDNHGSDPAATGKSPNWDTRAIWWIGGAIPSLLEHYPTEHGKYLGIGGAILGTWVLATLSSFLALQLVFDDPWIAGFGGAIWGLLIFNLDRFITVSMKKRGTTTAITSFWQRIGFVIQELLPAIPRLAIALIMGLLIAVPLELKIFEAEVERKLSSLRAEEEIRFFTDLDHQKGTRLAALEQDERANREQLEDLRRRYQLRKSELHQTLSETEQEERDGRDVVERARRRFLDEVNGTEGKSTEVIGIGPVALELKAAWMTEQALLEQLRDEQLKPRKVGLQVQLNELETWRGDEEKRLNQVLRHLRERKFQVSVDTASRTSAYEREWSSGILVHIKALARLRDEDSVIKWSMYLFMSLIFIIEAGPLLVKLISPRGPYDAKIDEIATMAMIESDARVKKLLEHVRSEQYKAK